MFFALLLTFTVAATIMADEPTVRAWVSRATVVDEDGIEFSFGNGRGIQLRNNQALIFVIPEPFRERRPDYAYIHHRKDRVYFFPDENGIDPNDARIRVDFFDPQKQTWVTWADQFGPLKRSSCSPPSRPKTNTLYNLSENVGPFSPTMVRVVNEARGDSALAVATFHRLGLAFLHQRENSGRKTRFFSDFQRTNQLMLSFKSSQESGEALGQGEVFELTLPVELQNHSIFHLILKHRKDPSLAADPENYDAFDANAAYVLCEVRDRRSGYWHKWADRSSLKKFSEIRAADNPENETLHNCLRTFGNIEPDRIRLTNVGHGDPKKCIAMIHGLEVLFCPDFSAPTVLSELFTPETSFAGRQMPVPLLGGGPRLGGLFPGALILGPERQKRLQAIAALPEKHRFLCGSETGPGYRIDDDGNLRIRLPANKTIESVELAIGDLDVTSLEYNKDGYFGRSGMAVATIELLSNGESVEKLLENNNIGMAGMIICGGPVSGCQTGNNDEIRVRIANDNAFLMGYRVLLR